MSRKPVIALIREGKVPPDRRIVFTPRQCREIVDRYGLTVLVEPSAIRCFQDEEFVAEGIPVVPEIRDADLFFGVKEVPVDDLIPGRTYLFFSHTMKKQPYNRPLLRAILEKKVRLIDYEALTDGFGVRVAAFGFYAGVVGAHNTLYAYGRRTGRLLLPRMKHLHDYAEAKDVYDSFDMPPIRVVLTGTGRVGKGAVRVLRDLGIREVEPDVFLQGGIPGKPCFTVLGAADYVRRRDGGPFSRADFLEDPGAYESAFAPYTAVADVFINAILWAKGSPAFFTVEDMTHPGFRIRTIGDITCDLAPDTSVPSTIRASTIQEPVYGFDPHTGKECEPFQAGSVDVMAIDNLPSELPRDASTAFGAALLEYVLPELLKDEPSPMIERATITDDGKLTDRFAYLADYVQ